MGFSLDPGGLVSSSGMRQSTGCVRLSPAPVQPQLPLRLCTKKFNIIVNRGSLRQSSKGFISGVNLSPEVEGRKQGGRDKNTQDECSCGNAHVFMAPARAGATGIAGGYIGADAMLHRVRVGDSSRNTAGCARQRDAKLRRSLGIPDRLSKASRRTTHPPEGVGWNARPYRSADRKVPLAAADGSRRARQTLVEGRHQNVKPGIGA